MIDKDIVDRCSRIFEANAADFDAFFSERLYHRDNR